MSTDLKTPFWAWLLVLFWCLATLGWLWHQQQDYFGVFDPERRLSTLPSYLPKAVTNVLTVPAGLLEESELVVLSGPDRMIEEATEQLFVILEPDCYCTSAARRHLTALRQRSQRTIVELTPKQLAQAGLHVPATPALLWWRDQQLWYAGPLSSGAVCGTIGDLLLPLLTGEQKLAGAWLNSETQTCRCVLPVQS